MLWAGRVNLKLSGLATSAIQKNNSLLKSDCGFLVKRTVDFDIVGLCDMVLWMEELKSQWPIICNQKQTPCVAIQTADGVKLVVKIFWGN